MVGCVSCSRECSAQHAVLAWLCVLQGDAVRAVLAWLRLLQEDAMRAVLAWCTVRPAGGDDVPDVLAWRSYRQQRLQGSWKSGLIFIPHRVVAERKTGKDRQCNIVT
jgi:hypothetical protein